MLSIEDISKIKAPIVWSLHDMWAFTGGCHYDEECGEYKNRCGNCKVLSSSNQFDLSTWILKRKQKSFNKHPNITIIGLSKWLSNCAKKSSLFKHHNILNLPNPINTDLFKPIEFKTGRDYWNLHKEKKLVLYGAMSSTSDPRKGYNELRKAIEMLNIENFELVIFGNKDGFKKRDNFKYKTHYLGLIKDDNELIKLLNTVDVIVIPSIQENLSNIIMESLSCGTPVVAFNIGGNSDMISHKNNGYLAKAYDLKDLANGIEWVLKSPKPTRISQNARKKIIDNFESKLVAKKYIKLYNEIIIKKLT